MERTKQYFRKRWKAIILTILLLAGGLSVPIILHSNTQQTRSTRAPPTINDFWVNSTWAGQNSQFAFNCSDNNSLVKATLSTNATSPSFTNSTVNLTGASAWANFTITNPSSNSFLAFQFWVWNSNQTINATTGSRIVKIYTYNSTENAWNTPYEYLGQAIASVEGATDWGSVNTYASVVLNKVPISSLRTMIDDYVNSSDWVNTLKWAAFTNKLNFSQYPSIQNDIQYSLGNYTMVDKLPYTQKYSDTAENTFVTQDKWALYGYYFNNCSWMGSYQNNTKWNITAAYNMFNSSIYNSYSWAPYHLVGGQPALWIFSNGTGTSYFTHVRMYDEAACCIECYLIFYTMLNVSGALNDALHWWDWTNNHLWSTAFNYYIYSTGYAYPNATSTAEYECEAAYFLKIASIFKYYYSTLQNWTYVATDIGNRFLLNEWDSKQWLDWHDNVSRYTVEHAWAFGATGNNQTRLYNTLGTWQALLGVYSQLGSALQSKMTNMLFGDDTLEPAWALLLNPMNGLYDNSTAQFKGYSTNSETDSDASATAVTLLFMMGIVPGNTTVAFPLEELSYEYLYDIDPAILAFNWNKTTQQIIVPITGAGTVTFQYGVSPLTYTFNQTGVWQITFTSSWNMITNVTQLSATLPTNLIYFA